MKIQLEYPFNDYAGYLVINPEGRKNICLIPLDKTKKRTTISYARYLVSVNEKRILSKKEQVDHIDGNKTNDVISNLQILSAKENTMGGIIYETAMAELHTPDRKEEPTTENSSDSVG